MRNTNDSTSWRRVSKGECCPICERPDWCLLTGPEGNADVAICSRVESAKPVGQRGAGWLHRLRDSADWQRPDVRTVRVPLARQAVQAVDLADAAVRYARAVTAERVEVFADSLGVHRSSLDRLQVGWSDDHGAWTFPMTDATGKVRGIRLRLPSGKKFSVTGGKEGLFLPSNLPEMLSSGEPLLIAEGPTDCAALLDLEFPAIGRPSCTGGVTLIVDLVRQRGTSETIIVADGDSPGERGAETLASVLVAYARSVRVITPPAGIKDVREWKRQGATRADVQTLIDAAPVRRLSIHSKETGVRNGK